VKTELAQGHVRVILSCFVFVRYKASRKNLVFNTVSLKAINKFSYSHNLRLQPHYKYIRLFTDLIYTYEVPSEFY
jgi:hypothetical protein